MKKKDLFILILSVLGIFIITMLINGIYPFGNNDLAISDGTAQYEPFLYDYITRLKNYNYYNYTFMNFLGNPSMFNFVYYLTSPFNFIALLFNNYKLMYLSVVIIKLIVASISAYYYFSKDDKKIGIIASICYVYSGWFLAYYFHIMWLDGFMMFPLLVIGVQNILKNNPIIYILTLTYIYISNFYIGYMLSLFVLIYYLFKLITMEEPYAFKIKNFLRMMLYTTIVIGISFFHIYNVYNIINKTKLVSYNYTNILQIKDFISALFSGNTKVINTDTSDYANICISVFALIGALSYFFNKKITKKEKIQNLVLIIIILIAFFTPLINYVISGFTSPAGFPLRYSFTFSFLLICLALKNYIKENINIFNYLIALTYLGILIYFYSAKIINLSIFILNLVMITIYFGYLIFNKKRFTKIIVPCCIILECLTTLCLNLKGTSVITNSNYFKSSTNNNYFDSSYSLGYFSSMAYKDPFILAGRLGAATDYKAKIIDINGVLSNIMKTKVFGANKDITSFTLEDDFITNRNNYIFKLTKTNNVYTKGAYNTKKDNNVITYQVKEDGTYFFTISSNQNYVIWNDNIYVTTNDLSTIPVNLEKYNISSELYICLLSMELKKNDEVIISYKDDNYRELFIENPKLVKEVNEKLNKYELQYDIKKDNHLKGTITLDDNMIIYTTIPYDNAWKITLNGKEITPINLEGGLIGIPANKGKHTLELIYDDVKLWPFGISILSIGVFIIIIKKHYKQNL